MGITYGLNRCFCAEIGFNAQGCGEGEVKKERHYCRSCMNVHNNKLAALSKVSAQPVCAEAGNNVSSCARSTSERMPLAPSRNGSCNIPRTI